ncbi:C-X-C motif chemokine 11-like [Pelodytes ibericus]
MEKTLTVVFCAFLLILPCVQGMSIFGKNRCRCPGRGARTVDVRSIVRVEIYPISFTCDKVDVIVTMKSRKQICIDPFSQIGKKIMDTAYKKKSKLLTAKRMETETV